MMHGRLRNTSAPMPPQPYSKQKRDYSKTEVYKSMRTLSLSYYWFVIPGISLTFLKVSFKVYNLLYHETLCGCTWASVETEWVFLLSVRTLLVMSAMDRPTDHDRWPRFFMMSNALKVQKHWFYFITNSRGMQIFLHFSNLIISSLKSCPYLSSNGLVTLDPDAISVWTPAFSPVLLITGTARQKSLKSYGNLQTRGQGECRW